MEMIASQDTFSLIPDKGDNMQDTLKNVFDETMQREAITATAFSSGLTFPCFFRRLSDGLNQRSTMTMFYAFGSPIHAGSIIDINGKDYICLNCETVENSVYKKSAVVECNGTISTQNASVMDLPFYGVGAESGFPSGNNMLSIIDGKAELITEDCSESRKLEINDKFNCWGRTWLLKNIFVVNGIVTLNVEVTADTDIIFEHGITFNDINASGYSIGDTIELDAHSTINGNITDAPLTYTSSDSSVATVDANGVISIVGAGSFFVTIVCESYGVSETTTETTVVEEVQEVVTLSVSKMGEAYLGFDSECTATIQKNGETVHDITFTAIVESSFSSKLKVTINQNNGLIKVEVPDSDYSLVGKSFDLVVSVPDYGLTNRQTVKITSFI